MFLKRLHQRLFSILPDEASFDRRGFEGGLPQTRERLNRVGYVFLQGYHMALSEELDALGDQLRTIPLEMQGFAFEGAAMALALLDYFTPWNRYRVRSFLDGAGADHVYMIHVGVGWAFARLPSRVEKCLKELDPLLGWLAIDGYGFHEGYFHASDYFLEKRQPKGLSDYGKRAFDQGLGRSLWFVNVADVERISATINSFPSPRHADLWSGVGLACTYAGGVDRATVELLRHASGYHSHLAQGAAFAAKSRQRAGNLLPHTEMACQILCGLSVSAAAEITDLALADLRLVERRAGSEPAYEVWRRRIQAHFAQEVVNL